MSQSQTGPTKAVATTSQILARLDFVEGIVILADSVIDGFIRAKTPDIKADAPFEKNGFKFRRWAPADAPDGTLRYQLWCTSDKNKFVKEKTEWPLAIEILRNKDGSVQILSFWDDLDSVWQLNILGLIAAARVQHHLLQQAADRQEHADLSLAIDRSALDRAAASEKRKQSLLADPAAAGQILHLAA